MQISRMSSARLFFVRTAPRRAFQPAVEVLDVHKINSLHVGIDTVCDLGSVQQREVQGDEPHVATAGLHAADYCLVFFREAGRRIVSVWETHGG